ncbi:hypothetical protein KFL_002080210 [Klebsormidium nitens]|uniref:Uncharacterized protein n=1 Tax=Klebsormidium nitens TaxID=105231 RepID=A0A1Y1I1Q3_KLENI|nr:hypothetical protein KFL_002080210 [Klebsormidium nitens]|eukprot:GAQ84844.1 hypothetical protein KFL_002080210 [Klebsormidium nitens]
MAQEGRKGPMEQDQNLPPTPLSRKQQLEQWQAQKRMSVESSKIMKGTPVKETPTSVRLAVTPLARASQPFITPSTSKAAPSGAPLGNNPALVNSEANTPQADRTAKYLHNASAKPAGILSPVKMGYPQRTPSKVGTPKAARVPLPAPVESSRPARVALPRTPLPSNGFKCPPSFEQKKAKEWTPFKGVMTGPLEAIAGRVAALKGSLTPQGKGKQAGETSAKPASALDSEGSLGATRGVGKGQLPAMKNEVEGVDVEQAAHSSYWLGRIREAEVRGDHGSVITLFEQAVEFNAQPAVDLVKALQQYRAKHMGGRSTQPDSQLETGLPKGQTFDTPTATLSQRQGSQPGAEAQGSKAEGPVTRTPAPNVLDTALLPAVAPEKAVDGSGQIEETGDKQVAQGNGSRDSGTGAVVQRAASPPLTMVIVTPVSPSERERQAKGGVQREGSPPAQEKGEDFQFYLTPVRQSPASATLMVEAAEGPEEIGVAHQEPNPVTSIPTVTAPRSDKQDGSTSPETETDKTDELPPLPPFSNPIYASPPGESSPTTLLPQNGLPLTQPQNSGFQTPTSGLKISKASGHQTPKASALQTPKVSGLQILKPFGLHTPDYSALQTPTPSRLQTPKASGSPMSFPRSQSSPETPEGPDAVDFNPAGGSPHTPRTPAFRGAAPAAADLMLTPAVSPLGWQPDAGGHGPQEPGSGPGQSTPAAIQMPSVQRSASRVTPDVIRTPGLSRRLLLDGEEPARTPNRTPLSRFALKSPNGGARRVPLFGGAEKLTPAKVPAPGSTVRAAGGVKEVADGRLTPTVRTEGGGVNGGNAVASEKLTPATKAKPGAAVELAACVNAMATEAASEKSQADSEGTLTSHLDQVTEFPVVLNGGKSLKPSPLNLPGAAKPASSPKNVSVPMAHMAGVGAGHQSDCAADANQGGKNGVEVDPPEGEHSALKGFVRMLAHVATETATQKRSKQIGALQARYEAVLKGDLGAEERGLVRGTAGAGKSSLTNYQALVEPRDTRNWRKGDVHHQGSGHNVDRVEDAVADTMRSPKKGASEVERWLRRARGQASPVTPADRTGLNVTPVSQVRGVDKTGLVPVTPADRTGPNVTPASQVRGVERTGLVPVEENQTVVDFPAVEDNGASPDAARSTEPAADVDAAGVNTSGKGPSAGVKTPRFGVRTLRNGRSPRETVGRSRGATETGGVNTPVRGGNPLAQGVNTPKSGSKGTPMLRQERARLPHLVIDNSKRTPVTGGRPGRGGRFNSLVETPPNARSSSQPEIITPGAATAEEWAAAADQIHQNQVDPSVSLNPAAFGSPVSPVNETGSSPETPPPSDTSPEVSPNLAPLLERLNLVSPRTCVGLITHGDQTLLSVSKSTPARQLSSRFTPSRLSRPAASSNSPPVDTPDQSKSTVARMAGDRGLNSGGKMLGSPAQRTPGLHGGRSAGKTGTRELRQLAGAPKLLGQGAAAAPAATTILSPVRASKHDRAALGADRFVLSPVRRSGRKPVGEGATKQTKSEVEELLEMTGYTYTPNKALSEPTSARKTPAARRMAQLTSGGSPPELAALEDAATCQDEEDATWHHVGAEEDAYAGDEGNGIGGDVNGDLEVGGTAEINAEAQEALVGMESFKGVGKKVGIYDLASSHGERPGQDERMPSVAVSDGAPEKMTSAEGAPVVLAFDTLPKETEALSQEDGVNAVGDVESLLVREGGVAVHTKRTTRRSAAATVKAPKTQWVVREGSAEGLAANPRRKASERKSVALGTSSAGQTKRKDSVREETGLLENSASESAGDKLTRSEVDVTGGEGLADEGGLTTESSGERGLRRGKAGIKTVSFAARVEAGVSDSFKLAVSGKDVGLQAHNGQGFKERVTNGRAGNRRKSLGAGLLAGHEVEKETGDVASANGGQELTTEETGAKQTRKQAGGRKRVSFAASPNPIGASETAETERRSKSKAAQAAARRQSVGAGVLPPGNADVSEEVPAVHGSVPAVVSVVVTATDVAGAPTSQSASEQEVAGNGARSGVKKARGRRAVGKKVAASEGESHGALADGSSDVLQSVEPATASATGAKGRPARSKGAVSDGAEKEGVTSAGRTRGSRAGEGAESAGTGEESPQKRGRGRKRAVEKVDGPVNGHGNGEALQPAAITGETVETIARQVPVGSSRTGRKSTVPRSEASAAQSEAGPVGKAAVGGERRALADSTNFQEGKKATGTRGQGAVKGKANEGAGPGKSVTTGESVKEPADVAVGTRIEVWWPDDKRFYGGIVTDYKARNGKHKVCWLELPSVFIYNFQTLWFCTTMATQRSCFCQASCGGWRKGAPQEGEFWLGQNELAPSRQIVGRGALEHVELRGTA